MPIPIASRKRTGHSSRTLVMLNNRLRAAYLHLSCAPHVAIAQVLGVNRMTVAQWMRDLLNDPLLLRALALKLNARADEIVKMERELTERRNAVV